MQTVIAWDANGSGQEILMPSATRIETTRIVQSAKPAQQPTAGFAIQAFHKQECSI